MRKNDITVKWPGRIQSGKIVLNTRHEFDTYVSMNFEGKDVWVMVGEIKRQRSINQNNYYWGVIIAIASDEMGCTPAETHHILGNEFLRYEKVLSNGKKKTMIRSTSDLNTAEAEDYYTQCRQYMSRDFNCYIPLPNEIDWKGSQRDIKPRK